MKTPGRNMMIGYDLTDPTVWEEDPSEGDVVSECIICGDEICERDDDIHYVDAVPHELICDRCFSFRKFTMAEVLDMLNVDTSRTNGRRCSCRKQ